MSKLMNYSDKLCSSKIMKAKIKTINKNLKKSLLALYFYEKTILNWKIRNFVLKVGLYIIIWNDYIFGTTKFDHLSGSQLSQTNLLDSET